MEKSSATVGSTYVDYPDHSTMYSSMRSLDYVGSMPQNIYHGGAGKHYGALDFTSAAAAGAQSQTNCFSHLSDSHHSATTQRLHEYSAAAASGCTTLNYMYGAAAGTGYPYATEANHYAQHPGNSESPDYPTHAQRHPSRGSPPPTSNSQHSTHYNGSYASESATVLNANSSSTTGVTTITGQEGQHGTDSRPVSNGDAGDRHTASSPGSDQPAAPGDAGLYKWMRIKRNPPKTGN